MFAYEENENEDPVCEKEKKYGSMQVGVMHVWTKLSS